MLVNKINNFIKKYYFCIKNIIKKLLLILSFIIVLSGYSQVICGDSTKFNTLNLAECGTSDTFTISLRNGTGAIISNVVLTDTLPSSLVYSSFVPNSAISSITISGNIITFNLNNISNNTSVNIQFLARLKCNVLSNITSLKMGLRLDYTGSIGSPINFISNDYIGRVNAPSLVISAIGNPNNSNGVVGQTYTRKWKIINNKIGSYIDTTRLKIVYQNGTSFVQLKINGSNVSPSIIGDTIRTTIIKKLRDNTNFVGDTILVEESYIINNCFNTSGSSVIFLFYGCFKSLYCKEFSNTASTQSQVTVPVLSITNTWKYACKGAYDTLNIRIINTGSGIARNIDFDVNSSYGDYFVEAGSPSSFFDSASSYIKKGINGSYTRIYKTSATHFNYTYSYWPVTKPARLLNYSIQQINSGDTLYFKVLFYNPCVDNSMCSINEKSVNTAYSYQNNCLNNTYTIARTNNRHERSDGAFKIDGSTDINVGDTNAYSIAMAPNSYTGYRYDTRGYLMYEISYSAGLNWVNSTNDLILKRLSDNTIDNPDSIYHDATARKIRVFYKFNQTTASIFATRSSFYIKPRFTLDCSGSPGSTGSISIAAFEKRDFGCNTSCLEPYGCAISYTLAMHCPNPCPRGGVSPFSATLSRTTLGAPDNNQDGLPDVSGSLDLTKIELNKVVALDTFVIKYKAKISRGSQSPSQFSFGYGETTFPTLGGYFYDVKAQIIIKDSSNNTKFTIPNLTNTSTTSGSDKTFKWNFSSNLSGYPGGYYFDAGDSIEVQCYYVFNPLAINYGADMTLNVDNFFYVSHYANPTNDTAKYRCDKFNCAIKTVSNYYTVYNPDNFVWNGCGSFISYYRAYLSIGECCNNYNGSIHFPYEYRSYGYWDSLRVYIPSGFSIDSANLYFSNGTKVGNANNLYRYTVTPISSNLTSNLYYIGKYFTPNGGSILPSRGGFYGHMQVYFKPSCKTPNATPLIRYSDYSFKSINTWGSRVNYLSSDAYPGYAAWSSIKNYGSGTTNFNGPALDISNSGAVSKPYLNSTQYWDVKIQNNSNISDGNNIWLAGYSKSGLIKIDSVKVVATNALLSSTNGIFKVGNVLKNAGNSVLRVYVSQSTCKLDSLTIHTGWNCNGYPSVFNNTVCSVDSTKIFLLNNTSQLAVQLLSAPSSPISLCDTFSYNLKVSQLQNFKLKSTFLDVQLPYLGAGVSIVANKSAYRYPNGTGSYQSISPMNMGNGLFRYYVSDSNSILKNNGLQEYVLSPNNAFELKLSLISNCNFVSGSEIKFIANGTNYCSQLVASASQSSIVDIIGAPVGKLYFTTSSATDIKPCNSAVSISVKLRNLQTSATSKADKLYMLLPEGVFYSSNSVSFNHNRFSDTLPIITIEGGRQLLTWVADSIPVNDSSIVKIKIYASDNVACNSSSFLEVETRTIYVASCQSSNCFSQVLNSIEKINANVKKPDIRFVSGTASVIKDTTIGNIYVADTLKVSNLLLNNFGNDTGNLNMYFFNDANHNNKFDSTETIFYKDSIKNFANNTNSQYSKTLIFGHKSLSDTVKILARVKCNCNKTDFVISPVFNYVPLLEHSIVLDGNIKGNTAQLWFAGIADVLYYVLERKLVSEITFSEISKIEANKFNVYSINDLLNGHNCDDYIYRIKAVTISNQIIFSNQIELTNCNFTSYQLIPNPSNNLATLKFSNAYIKNASFNLVNSIGKIIEIKPLSESSQAFVFNFSEYSDGVYTLQMIFNNGQSASLKFVVKH